MNIDSRCRMRSEIAMGTLRAIIRQAGLTIEEFRRLL